MNTVSRLLTSVDVDDRAGDQISVSARLEVELADGSRVMLLDDRGWSESGEWDTCSVAEVVDTSRVVVGPDEPFGGRSQQDMAADHWRTLAGTARAQGVAVDATELSRLPHDVVLGRRLLARLSRT
ncbi:hypothetical protein O2W18_15125 [Modestobacter sp. VKM Ac-2983]|uniref:hypothetical protein n=1 Tax=Modestobacter sp. VKM Ac-2983 TaxID=3004137 RepID=UPI0022AB55EA|nr:hypothetical protein [Modestobacter sp. VKM Ac-2983]MCZ2806441.1 hypothetical protein [Modestobacter sp. VKM Ac-2983]